MLFGLVLIGEMIMTVNKVLHKYKTGGRKYTTELWLNGEVACSMVNSESLLYYAWIDGEY